MLDGGQLKIQVDTFKYIIQKDLRQFSGARFQAASVGRPLGNVTAETANGAPADPLHLARSTWMDSWIAWDDWRVRRWDGPR